MATAKSEAFLMVEWPVQTPQNLFDSLTDRLEIANALKHLFGVIFVRQIGQYPKFKMISEKNIVKSSPHPSVHILNDFVVVFPCFGLWIFIWCVSIM